MRIPPSAAWFVLLLVPAAPAQDDAVRPPGVTPEIEAAIARGLDFLVRTQNRDGSWRGSGGYGTYPTAMTGLAGMALLGSGATPTRGKHWRAVRQAVDFLMRSAQPDGVITAVQEEGRSMYGHGFATLFLAEVYGMTRRQDVRQALQKAVNLIVDSQNAEGGWRYKPFARESDMSITVCQVLALRSARNVGITVPSATIRAAEIYVERSAVQDGQNFGRNQRFRYGGMLEEGGAFRYQLLPHSRATVPLTAAGITTLYAAGNYDHPMIPPALDYLDSNLDDFNRSWGPEGHYFFYYGHYYAVQAYYVTGGERWNLYFRRMKQELLAMQRANGSWPCETGPGEAFGTAVATLILQIPYQYLPIFQR